MPHNFKILNGANISYVSKAGVDDIGRNSADPNLAHRTVGFACAVGSINLIIGTGQYFQDTPVGWNNGGKSFTGDGKVIISGGGGDNSPFAWIVVILSNLEVTDYKNITAGLKSVSGGTNRNQAIKCIFRRGAIQFGNDSNNSFQVQPLIKDCICINAPAGFYSGNSDAPQTDKAVVNSLFIGSPVEFQAGAGSAASWCYFDETSPLTLAAPAAQHLPKFCNIRGPLIIEGVPYASLADAAVAWPALLANGNINADPQFNRAAAEDFTLKLASPHLDLGIGPSHLRYSLMYYIQFSGAPGDVCNTQNTKLVSTADGSTVAFREINGFTVNEQGGLVIIANSSNNFEAYYLTDKIKVAATAQPITNLPVIFAANFNSDYPTAEGAFNSIQPEVYNNNVPARNNFSSGSAGRNPHRLTILARFTALAFPDINSTSDWVGNNYMEFEIGTTPTYNATTAIGNGSPLYDPTPANVTQMVARWVQVSYRVRNNYYSQ